MAHRLSNSQLVNNIEVVCYYHYRKNDTNLKYKSLKMFPVC
jgi:hypothetical protein